MACLSLLDPSGLMVVCANPVFPLSEPDSGTFIFEVFEADAGMLKSRIGKVEQYGLDPNSPPFFGRVTNIEPCESTHSSLVLLRDKPTLRVAIAVHKAQSSASH